MKLCVCVGGIGGVLIVLHKRQRNNLPFIQKGKKRKSIYLARLANHKELIKVKRFKSAANYKK